MELKLNTCQRIIPDLPQSIPLRVPQMSGILRLALIIKDGVL